MQIGELEMRAGVSTRALRHYESRQLLESTRLDNGYRDYAPSMVQRVLWVGELLECGFCSLIGQAQILMQLLSKHLEHLDDPVNFA
ncbi:MerR family DNA-binding transcriptional regulator [Pseudomonas plecoglossicida]|uniref:MerR family DNA-binding transcriptional regulator n=1 Tax=Pseudomonas plecoglossicida TaxID=70775 RepID=UPI003D1FA36F